jgi:hypothetical protein
MATYPGAKVHRVNRRKLGRGQYPTGGNISVVLTDATTVLTMTFSAPVVVTGQIPVTVAGGPTFVSQTVVSQTVVQQTWSATLVGHLVTFPANAANVSTYQGGKVAGTSITF